MGFLGPVRLLGLESHPGEGLCLRKAFCEEHYIGGAGIPKRAQLLDMTPGRVSRCDQGREAKPGSPWAGAELENVEL